MTRRGAVDELSQQGLPLDLVIEHLGALVATGEDLCRLQRPSESRKLSADRLN